MKSLLLILFIGIFTWNHFKLVAAEASHQTPVVGGSTKIFGGGGLVDKSMNPAISVNGLFLGRWGSAVEPLNKGLQIQEIEGIFSASVDPYFYGNVVFTSENLGPVGVEEAYVTTLSLPRVTVKAGKFLTPFGKNNILHTHGQPLIDKPLVNQAFFTDEGMSSIGLEAALLVPTPWYFDLMVGIARSRANAAFSSSNPESVLGTARMEHLFDLTDDATISVGTSYAGGENSVPGKSNHFLGGDFTLKYITGKGKGDFGFSFTNEFIHAWQEDATAIARNWGIYSTPMVRLSQWFWVGGRFDLLRASTADVTKQENIIIAYVPSEFSTLRLQSGLRQLPNTSDSQWISMLQFNTTIGSHPAHSY